MKRIILCTIALTFLINFDGWGGNLPEYTGNYIENNGNWLELKTYKLNTLSLWGERKNDSTLMGYSGLFSLTDVPCLKDNTPRILLYSGREQADPRTLALVRLERLPYNNAIVYKIDNTDYQDKIRYKKEHVTKELWTFKKEIRLRFKPVEGKTGMYEFIPKETLPEGVYALDSGSPSSRGGHIGLDLHPEPLFNKTLLVQTAIPFIIGSKVALIQKSAQPENGKDIVAAIQRELRELGYYNGAIDGIAGKGTASAIKAYQNDNNLTPDGKPSEELSAHLKSKKESKDKEPKTLEESVNKAVDGLFKAIFKTK